MGLSERDLTKAAWTLAFTHDEPGLKAAVFTNNVAPDITMTQLARGSIRSRHFRAFGQKYDTLADVVRGYNAEKSRRFGRYAAPGSVESLRILKASRP